jgi:hypothetical protein
MVDPAEERFVVVRHVKTHPMWLGEGPALRNRRRNSAAVRLAARWTRCVRVWGALSQWGRQRRARQPRGWGGQHEREGGAVV